MSEVAKIGSYEEWEASVPELMKGDSLWKMQAYRKALFLGDLAWFDLQKLNQHRWLWSLSDQLYRATGSVPILLKGIHVAQAKIVPDFMNMPSGLPVRAEIGISKRDISSAKKYSTTVSNF